MRQKQCTYCPLPANGKERDHVIPACLYSPSALFERIQRIKVPVCRKCNRKWSVDEPHFKSVLTISGSEGVVQQALWDEVSRSFTKLDGESRRKALAAQLEETKTDSAENHMIYPGKDQKVLKIVRKVVRGLAHHHKVFPYVDEGRVFVDLMRFKVQKNFLDEMHVHHAGKEICEYKYSIVNDVERDIHSGWLITFLGRVQFIGIISISSLNYTNLKSDG